VLPMPPSGTRYVSLPEWLDETKELSALKKQAADGRPLQQRSDSLFTA